VSNSALKMEVVNYFKCGDSYRQAGLHVSQPHRPPRLVTGIALFVSVVFIVCNVSFNVCGALCAVFCVICVS
jgi:hypothetical protein